MNTIGELEIFVCCFFLLFIRKSSQRITFSLQKTLSSMKMVKQNENIILMQSAFMLIKSLILISLMCYYSYHMLVCSFTCHIHNISTKQIYFSYYYFFNNKNRCNFFSVIIHVLGLMFVTTTFFRSISVAFFCSHMIIINIVTFNHNK